MAMNNKNTPSGKSLKMSADDLKEMVKAAPYPAPRNQNLKGQTVLA